MAGDLILSDKKDLLAIGHTAFDYIIQINEFPEPNTSTAINKMRTLFGGAAANVAVVASNLGLKSLLVSAVGDDFLRSEYEDKLKKLNINTENMIVIEDEKTPTAFVLTNSNHDQISYFYWGAASQFKNSKPPIKAIESVKAVHLATGDPGFNIRSGKVAYELGKLISFDPGQDLHMYSKNKLEKVLNICNILFGNHHEIQRIQEVMNMTIDDLINFGPDIVVTTYGENGSSIYTDEEIKINAIKRDSVDPTGAGDSYRAGFLNAYLKGEDLETCGKFASTVASFIVEAEGCQTNIPTENMVRKRMKIML